MIITIRRTQDGGKFNGGEDGADHAAAHRHRRRRRVRRPGRGHRRQDSALRQDQADHQPARLSQDARQPRELHARLAELDADIVKMATMANHPHDNLRMLRLVRDSKLPTVGICMGDIGTPSRMLAGRFGSPFTYATFHHERTLAPGQLSFQQMSEIYHYDKIDAETELYGVIGDPIGHSLSPLIHNAAFRAAQMTKVYVPFRIPREDLASFIDDARELGIRGLSVTIPHKEAVLKWLGKVDGAVQGSRRGQHDPVRERRTVRLQHRLSRGDGQPGSGHGTR